MTQSPFPLLICVTILLSACAGTPPVDIVASPGYGSGAGSASAGEPVATDSPSPQPEGILTLADAQAAALLGNPGLSGVAFEIRAADARIVQAGLYPNPEFEFEVEDFGGSDDLAGMGGAGYTFALSQEIPLGGKIGTGEKVARLESRLAAHDYEIARLDVLAGVESAFVDVLAMQERMKVERESVRAAQEVTRAVTAQVASGKSPPLEEQKASLALKMERLRLYRTERELENARRQLAANWGATSVTFDAVGGDLTATRPVPSASDLLARIGANPDLARYGTELELQQAILEQERAAAWPDVTVAAGVTHSNESDSQAFLAGFSVPLPLFDRNQGNVAAALADVERVREAERAALIEIRVALAEAWQELSLAEKEALALKNDVVPVATEAFDSAREGFAAGKFEYLEVLDAQRTLFEAKQLLIEALAAYHHALADVDRLVGGSADPEGEDR